MVGEGREGLRVRGREGGREGQRERERDRRNEEEAILEEIVGKSFQNG